MYLWLERLRNKGLIQVIVVDLLMLLLLWVNLNLIVFDAIFSIQFVQDLFLKFLPGFHSFYDLNIHSRFEVLDLIFVSVFILELLISWAIAVIRQTYHRWFFYPFVHWYDVLGCIPVGSLRFLRVLRVVSILVKMQKLQIIDLTKTYLFHVFKKYLDVLTEEVSDRVVVNVLNGVSDEIKGGNPVYGKILNQVVLPRKAYLNDWISDRIQRASLAIRQRHEAEFRIYLRKLTRDALAVNKGMKELKLLPFFGSYMEGLLEEMISEITFEVMIQMTRDFGSGKSKDVVADISDMVLDIQATDSSADLNDLVKEMVLDTLTIIKDQVQVQQWKLRDLEERAERRRERLERRLGEMSEVEDSES